jgi:hypothetical protein
MHNAIHMLSIRIKILLTFLEATKSGTPNSTFFLFSVVGSFLNSFALFWGEQANCPKTTDCCAVFLVFALRSLLPTLSCSDPTL